MNTPDPAAIPAVPLEEYTKRAVRAWWADGLWDFAMAGFFAVTALWAYPFVRVLAFPSWTWPWPFITQEPVNPLQHEITLWGVMILPVWIMYFLGANVLIRNLKAWWIAPRTGDVRHAFFLPVEKKIFWLHMLSYAILLGLTSGLCMWLKGGSHWWSLIFIASPTGVLYLVGQRYRLPRYRWMALAGFTTSLLLELVATGNADYARGPQHFLDVAANYGNPALPLAVWTAVCIVGGATALRQTLRQPHEPAE
ncbi:MAG: hypothetical protein JXR84_04080 [Anaerolineae bacterium]|nr:hypothetical protein [Anaerolineae bacterium]